MTPPIRMVSVPVDEYGRLIEVCNGLIGELSDPGTEALAAVYCAERILHIALTAAPVREEGGAVDADTILEMAAKAVEDHQKIGREWIKGSLWDDLTREASARIRALKADVRAQPPALTTAFMTRAKHLLDLAEKAEDDALEGDEGCVWPVEALRVAYTDLSALATREEAPAEAGEAFLSWLEREIDEESCDIGATHQEGGSATERERSRLVTLSDVRAKYLALRAQPPAREDAQPVAPWGHAVKFGANGWGFADDEDPDAIDALKADPEYQVLALYTHPVPDALRVAVEALAELSNVGMVGRARHIASQALLDLAALQQDGQ
ncbi:hypothetical protein [Brevundimonas diminuta]|uniref:hypothetical protein n=1 Tax=Brevundimonas diminuta TaxID=293 RepID=UPI0032097BF9